MTLPSSGAISINSLVGEYGGSAPHSMSEYYRGGGLVANHSNNGNVPTSGTISLSNFYGQNNTAPVDNTYTINGGGPATRGVILGSGSNFGWCASAPGGYAGSAYGNTGSGTDTSAQLANNTTKRMLTGAVGYTATDSKGTTTYGIELFFGTDQNTNLTSGTTGYPQGSISTTQNELAGNKLKVGGTQFVAFPSSVNSFSTNGISGINAGTNAGDSAKMNGYYSHRITINSNHSSSGSTAIGSGITSTFNGNGINIQITT